MIQSCDVVGKVRGDASTLVQRAAGLMLLAVLVPNLLSCFTGAERDSLRAGRDARQTTAHQRTTPSGKRVEHAPARESETAKTDTPIRWDSVALGDSLAAGVGAHRGYGHE